jgi:hypothetical protein
MSTEYQGTLSRPLTEDETTRVITQMAVSSEWLILNRDPSNLKFRFNDMPLDANAPHNGWLQIDGTDVYVAFHVGGRRSFLNALVETLSGFGVHCHFDEI